ncbi:MAG: S41 family peptidase [Phycisphaerales bacterium]
MSIKAFVLTIFAGAAVAAHGAVAEESTHDGLIQYPSISPDAKQIVFSAAGDLWAVPVSGGAANRLTTHPGIETQSRFNWDGSQIVFESNRNGAQNLYLMDVEESRGGLVGGDIERITISDRSELLGGFSRDDKSVLFSAYMYPEIYRHPRMYQQPIDGGPMTKVTQAFGRGPATHPDRDEIYFIRGYYYPHRVAYRGPGNLDIWAYQPDDGTFRQVTRFDGNDMNPCLLPDGGLVYISSRDGQYNLVRIEAGGDDQQPGAVKQLTHFRPSEEHPTTITHGVRDLCVSEDGTTAVFVVWNTLYTLDLTDDSAMPRVVDVSFGSDSTRDLIEKMDLARKVSEAAVHPADGSIAQVARGEIFVRSTEEDHPTRRITATSARERDIVWSPDGVRLYFTSDMDGSLGSIYEATVSLAMEDLEPMVEEFKEESTEEVAEEAVESNSDAGKIIEESDDSDGDGVADSNPDADDQANEASDVNEEDKEEEKIDYAGRWADALRFEIKPVVQDEGLAFAPHPSPDGTKLMYLRARGDIVIRDLMTGEDRVVVEQWSEPDILWASDSRHIVYTGTDLDFNTDIFLLDTQVGEDGELADAVNISRHPDIDHSPSLSHDGKVLSFLSDRDNENWAFDVYRVYLDRDLDGLSRYDLASYYEEAISEAKKIEPIEPVSFDGADADDDAESEPSVAEALEFDADDAYLRIRRITTTPESESGLAMTPAGDRMAFSSVIDGSRTFVSVDYKGKDRKTIRSGSVGDPRVSINGKSLSLVAGGQAMTTTPAGGKAETLAIHATIELDRQKELAEKFNEAAGRFGMSFYHPTMKGLDWEAITERYRGLVMQTRTKQAFQRLMNLMWGEVDGSHTGIWGGDGFSASSSANGYLGIDFTPIAEGYRIDAVMKGGPIDRLKDGPVVGDVITMVGDIELATDSNDEGLRDLHASLAGLSGKELLLGYQTTGPDGESIDRMVLVKPTSYGAMSVIRYHDEVEKRRAQVDEMSGGKLGYLHIRSMGLASVREYERDLFAAADGKDGLIIDVRDNGGGWTTDILLASLTAPDHAYTIPRGAKAEDVRSDSYPRDRRLIYAYSRPISVLINEHSFSNAEIFAHSIRYTKRGTLVGTQTFGGVISTGSFQLIDGTTVRRPFRGWYLPDGTDMEEHGAMPDIDVPQTPTDEAAGLDPQLEAAVQDLMSRTGN